MTSPATTTERCQCCDLEIGCGTQQMEEIRRDDPVWADYLDGVPESAGEAGNV